MNHYLRIFTKKKFYNVRRAPLIFRRFLLCKGLFLPRKVFENWSFFLPHFRNSSTLMSPLSNIYFLDLSRQADLNLSKGWRVIATLIESSESASGKLLISTLVWLKFLNFLWFRKLYCHLIWCLLMNN